MTNPSIWDPSSDTVPAVRPQTFLVEQTFYAEEGQTSFNLTQFSYEPNTGTLRVYVNGVRITGIQETSSTAFELPVGTACAAGDKVFVEALLEEVSASQSPFVRATLVATEGQSSFPVAAVEGKHLITLNGVFLSYPGDYTLTGTTVELVEAANEGDLFEAIYFALIDF